MKTTMKVAVTVLLSCLVLSVGSAHAENGPATGPGASQTAANPGPSPVQTWINNTVPAPPLAWPSPATNGQQSALWHSVLASPVSDPFFDSMPAGIDKLRQGQLIAQRDVTAPVSTLATTPIRSATLLKFRSTSALGAPSFGTATLITPTAPWTGPGTRPVLVYTLPINSLGLECTVSYTFGRGQRGHVVDVFLPTIWAVVSRGFAVLLPDHEGRFMSYAEPNVAAHVVLDSIRAVRSLNQFHDSRFGITGYSGGAIASYASAMLLHEYAPELASSVVGAAMGGLVVDDREVAHRFNGNLASGILMSVTLAMAREHSDLLPYMNHLAQWLAISPLKDVCGEADGPLGEIGIPIDLAANISHPLDDRIAEQLYRMLDLTGRKSAVPLYIYHGTADTWIPIDGPRKLFLRQCQLGVPAVFHTLPGKDHLGAIFQGFDASESWLEARMRGIPAPNGCP
jgi:hypothetical protein